MGFREMLHSHLERDVPYEKNKLGAMVIQRIYDFDATSGLTHAAHDATHDRLPNVVEVNGTIFEIYRDSSYREPQTTAGMPVRKTSARTGEDLIINEYRSGRGGVRMSMGGIRLHWSHASNAELESASSHIIAERIRPDGSTIANTPRAFGEITSLLGRVTRVTRHTNPVRNAL